MCYILFGRAGIIAFNTIMGTGLIAIGVLFYSFFVLTALSVGQISRDGSDHYLMWKSGITVALAVAQMFVSFQRHLGAFAFQRFLQPVGILSVIGFMIWLVTNNPDKGLADLEPPLDIYTVSTWKVVDAVNTIVTSYGFVINFYPFYDNLQPSSRNWCTMFTAVVLACFIALATYASFSIMAISAFGLDNIQASIFDNFTPDMGAGAIVVRLMFLIMFTCTIPYLMFACKMCFMNLYAEISACKVSEAMAKNEVYNVLDEVDESVNKTIVVVLKLIIAFVAIVSENLTKMFSVPAAFSESLANMILPGLFLFSTSYMIRSKISTPWLVLQMVSGILMCLTGLSYTCLALTSTFMQ